ncbi:type I-B CRISPR-associated endonuclease Cas1b [Melioribacteraceae bacterium 4301-Me]|uniref:type I-B CRISPR-associated endonuclease Cas1b n=1 Tax=Pyranulibacter aquaticus TaxID=3163344 RepID=UPI00359AE629
MKRNYYIFSSGKLIRKDNTLYFEPGESKEPEEVEVAEEEIQVDDSSISENESEDLEPKKLPRKPIPVEDIDSIYCFSELRFNTKFLNFISQKEIVLHLFNYYGYYSGSFYPREPYLSGKLLVEQVQTYSDNTKRVALAKKFVEGAAENIRKNLQYYNARDKDLSYFIEKTEELISKIDSTEDVQELMGIEGNIRSNYYFSWNLIIDQEINFEKRQKHPPSNPINALISFGNSLVYTTVLSEIYKTQLNPLISFLHEPGERRFSLSLDIAEIFKPLLSDKLIFSLLNKKQIQEKHFSQELNKCYLTEEGRKIFLKEFDEKLKTTIQHRQLKKSVSYRHLIRLECYKIIKHLLGEKEYKPFKIWW